MGVNQFGLGPYDSDAEGEHGHGEDANEKVTKKSLPDGGGSDVQCPDRLMSYPDEHPVLSFNVRTRDGRVVDHEQLAKELADMIRSAAGMLPGDPDSDLGRGHGHGETVEDPVATAASGLPDEEPAARSDYFDDTVVGQNQELWPDEDSGAFAGEHQAESALPGVSKNEVTMDDFLGALGNAWSGYEVEDVSGPQGFPTTDRVENVDFPKSNDGTSGGRLVASKDENMSTPKSLDSILAAFGRGEITIGGLFDAVRGTNTPVLAGTGHTAGSLIDRVLRTSSDTGETSRKATDLAKVGALAEEFLKEFGKKDLTKRHVLAFLQKKGEPQFLSSDVIRCLKHRHEVYVKDVLDEFPVAKQASAGLSSVRDRVISLEIENVRNPEVAKELRRVAAALTMVIVMTEKA